MKKNVRINSLRIIMLIMSLLLFLLLVGSFLNNRVVRESLKVLNKYLLKF